MSILRAIRAKCLDCVTYQQSEVAKCTVVKCALYPYRMGKNPFRQKRVLSDEQRQAAADRFKKHREARTALIKARTEQP